MEQRIVYVIGAGFSAGLGFPTISSLLQAIWPRLVEEDIDTGLAKIIQFHHPAFNPSLPWSFVNVETLLSEMQANEQLFDSTRPATGGFTSEQLADRRQEFLLVMANWFHEMQRAALKKKPEWLTELVKEMKREKAQIISFNWDLVLDELLFGNKLGKESYGFDDAYEGVRLIKPHGSLNWYEQATGRFLKQDKRFELHGTGEEAVYAFRPFRAPSSSRRTYMPLIVAPVFAKEFGKSLFPILWREAVSTLSKASEVRFLGYSMADADFHARFVLRCGFYNQEFGALDDSGQRRPPTHRSRVTIVDPSPAVGNRIEDAVGWRCDQFKGTVEEWMASR